MRKKERAKIILKKLNELYPEPPIPLMHSDEFTLLVAVVLSAQSTDKKVNEITPDLFKAASNPALMYKLGKEKIYTYIKQLGLSRQKAKNIYLLSEKLIREFNHQVPSCFEHLESLPGVGHKTASVIMSQCFGIPTFPVDTHIHRLAQRWELTNGTSVLKTEQDLKLLFPKPYWNKLHLQIIFYGREYCTARGCNGMICPLCKELFPNRKNPIVTRKA